jgi:acetyl esterase
VYFHGGGWATGSAAGFAAVARNLARFSGGLAIAVDYRLAPEHRFPGPIDDCLAATRWAFAQAEALGIDPRRVLLAGDSAGAHLALSVALALRDARRADAAAPEPAGVAAFYPCLDPSCDTPSWDALGRGRFLTRERMRWFWEAFLGPKLAARPDARATPWLAEDLAGLPPTWISVAEHDPLRDEGQAFAHDLAEAGVDQQVDFVPGMLHGYLRWRTLVPRQADETVRRACDWLLGR